MAKKPGKPAEPQPKQQNVGALKPSEEPKTNSLNRLVLQTIILLLALLPIITIATSLAITYHLLTTQRPTKSAPTELPLTSATPRANLTTNQYYLGSGSYDSTVAAHSKSDGGTKGQLFAISNQLTHVSFISAFNGSDNVTSLTLANGWKAKKLGVDGMWVPGACAQKPSWLIGSRFIVIDDGSYSSNGPTHYYAAYDIQTKQFIEFGGSVTTDTKPNEKILAVNGEGDKLVFYIDLRDPIGPFTNSSNFKHSRVNRENYIIRRVISLPDLKYDDFKVPYSASSAPSTPTFDTYYTKVNGYGDNVRLELSTDGTTQEQVGNIMPNHDVSLAIADSTKLPDISKIGQGFNAINSLQNKLNSLLLQKYPALAGPTIPLSSPSLSLSPTPTPPPISIGLDYSGQNANLLFFGAGAGAGGQGSTGIPGIYNQNTGSIDLAALTNNVDQWNNVSDFTLGTFLT